MTGGTQQTGGSQANRMVKLTGRCFSSPFPVTSLDFPVGLNWNASNRAFPFL